MSDVISPPESSDIIAGTGRVRRSAWGRLYQGETSIDFEGRKWWGLTISGILILITVISLFVNGLNLGIDFEGGVAWEVPSAHITEAQVKDILKANNVNTDNEKLRTLTSASGVKRLSIQVGDYPPAVVQKVQTELAAKAGVDVSEVSSTSVSSSWGHSITEKAIRALIIFLVLVALFISWRFEWRMALAAIAAMLHDVLISVGVYSVVGFEVTPATVVAFLTILGFSLYDTIVVFDKMKENTQRYTGTRASMGDVVNVSMNQVLMRSLNTSIAAVLPVLSLLVVGSGIMGAVALREFSLALLIGLITGSYSSIFVATPLVSILKEREPRYRSTRGQRATGAELERMVHGGSPEGHRRETARSRRAGADGTTAVITPVTPTPQAVLTHPPRPRKKKRR
ncbi:MAG: Protein-export rane protein SecF [Ilumatobacteraceae bacterium]|nr:Protein-export rane protein SecF [Ilumatobacteraceae bacterium]